MLLLVSELYRFQNAWSNDKKKNRLLVEEEARMKIISSSRRSIK